jgi:hypothetical protein
MLGQKARQVAAPCRRVFAGSMALRLGRAENRFDASAQARGGFRFRLPKRRQNSENCRRINLVDRALAQWRGVFF